MFYIQKNNLKNTKILFIFFLFFTPKNNWKDKNFSFWPKLFRNNQFNKFHHILFQSDKNDENNNLRMNEINFKQVNLFQFDCFEWKLFVLNWVFQLMNFIFHLIDSFQLEEFNWIIKDINLNHQFWLKSFFLPVEKIIFLQMKYQFQWNDNLFIIEFFLSISILNESFELKVHIKLNRKILIQRLQEIYLSMFQQLIFGIDESSIQMLDEIQWMI